MFCLVYVLYSTYLMVFFHKNYSHLIVKKRKRKDKIVTSNLQSDIILESFSKKEIKHEKNFSLYYMQDRII